MSLSLPSHSSHVPTVLSNKQDNFLLKFSITHTQVIQSLCSCDTLPLRPPSISSHVLPVFTSEPNVIPLQPLITQNTNFLTIMLIQHCVTPSTFTLLRNPNCIALQTRHDPSRVLTHAYTPYQIIMPNAKLQYFIFPHSFSIFDLYCPASKIWSVFRYTHKWRSTSV